MLFLPSRHFGRTWQTVRVKPPGGARGSRGAFPLTAAACAWQVIGRNGANFTKDGSLAHANLASLYLKLCPNHLFQLQVWTDVENKLAQISASCLSGGCSQRQIRPQAAPCFRQPWPISPWTALAGYIGLVFDIGLDRLRAASKNRKNGRRIQRVRRWPRQVLVDHLSTRGAAKQMVTQPECVF